MSVDREEWRTKGMVTGLFLIERLGRRHSPLTLKEYIMIDALKIIVAITAMPVFGVWYGSLFKAEDEPQFDRAGLIVTAFIFAKLTFVISLVLLIAYCAVQLVKGV